MQARELSLHLGVSDDLMRAGERNDRKDGVLLGQQKLQKYSMDIQCSSISEKSSVFLLLLLKYADYILFN